MSNMETAAASSLQEFTQAHVTGALEGIATRLRLPERAGTPAAKESQRSVIMLDSALDNFVRSLEASKNNEYLAERIGDVCLLLVSLATVMPDVVSAVLPYMEAKIVQTCRADQPEVAEAFGHIQRFSVLLDRLISRAAVGSPSRGLNL